MFNVLYCYTIFYAKRKMLLTRFVVEFERILYTTWLAYV